MSELNQARRDAFKILYAFLANLKPGIVQLDQLKEAFEVFLKGSLSDEPEPEPVKPDPFNEAKFYSCRENVDSLAHESPEEAIEEVVDSLRFNGERVDDAILKAGSLEVIAYGPKKLTSGDVEGMTEACFDLIQELASEEYGDPYGDHVIFDPNICRPIVREAVQKVCDKAKVWACEKVASRTYSPEEVLALMKEENPEWFE